MFEHFLLLLWWLEHVSRLRFWLFRRLLLGLFLPSFGLDFKVECFTLASFIHCSMPDGVVEVLSLQLLESVFCVDHELREAKFANFLILHVELYFDIFHLLPNSFKLLIGVLPDLFLFRHLKFVDLELAIELLLDFVHHVLHLSDVVFHLIVLNFHLCELPFGVLELLIRLVHGVFGLFK